jgi:leucyl aminopeptidase (aminopeptidase T)
MTKATGAYGIPAGDVFIANEAGAELVGSINGKTSVANQGQIIEGIQRGVAEANSEQNTLLRQQNELLRGILEKDSSVRLSASAALGRTVQQSLNMYGSMVGG